MENHHVLFTISMAMFKAAFCMFTRPGNCLTRRQFGGEVGQWGRWLGIEPGKISGSNAYTYKMLLKMATYSLPEGNLFHCLTRHKAIYWVGQWGRWQLPHSNQAKRSFYGHLLAFDIQSDLMIFYLLGGCWSHSTNQQHETIKPTTGLQHPRYDRVPNSSYMLRWWKIIL
jgi:hypothetical protein